MIHMSQRNRMALYGAILSLRILSCCGLVLKHDTLAYSNPFHMNHKESRSHSWGIPPAPADIGASFALRDSWKTVTRVPSMWRKPMIPMILPFSLQGTPAPRGRRIGEHTEFGAPASTINTGSKTPLALGGIQWY